MARMDACRTVFLFNLNSLLYMPIHFDSHSIQIKYEDYSADYMDFIFSAVQL